MPANGVATPTDSQFPDFLDLGEQPRLTHKQKCRNHAQEFLQHKDLQAYWNDADFDAYYRKHQGSQANPYFFGIDVADYIIRQAPARLLDGE